MPKRLPAWTAAGVFVLLLLRPAYIAHLRERLRREDPAAWENLPTNGRFRLLLPQLVAMRYHDEAFYASCAREVLRRGRPRNPFWDDRGLGSWVQNSVSLYLLAAAGWLCGGDMNRAWCLAVALLGAAWFLLYYRVFLWWSGKPEVAHPLALFSTLFPDVLLWLLDVNFSVRVNVERYAAALFQNLAELRPHFYRLPSSFLTMFILGWLLLGAWRLACQTRRRPLPAAALGAGFGLLAWVHPFELALGMSTLMVFAAAAWLKGERPEPRRNLTLAFLVALPVSLACAAAVSLSVSPEAWREHLELLGISHSRRPYLITVVHLIFAAFGALQLRRERGAERRTAWLLLISAQLASFLCRNAQVVLGFSIQPFHYIPPASMLGGLMLTLFLARRLAQEPLFGPGAGLAASFGIALLALANEKAAAESTYRLFGMPRATETALDWARDNIPEDSAVLSLSMMVNESLPLYTRARPFMSPLGLITTPFTFDEYLAKVARLLKTSGADADRFLSERWLLPGDRARLQARLDFEQRTLATVDPRKLEPAEWFYTFHRGYRDDDSVLRGREALRRLAAEAEPLRSGYYLWVDADDARLLARPPAAAGGRAVYRGGGITIYEFQAAGGGRHG